MSVDPHLVTLVSFVPLVSQHSRDKPEDDHYVALEQIREMEKGVMVDLALG